jgi:hypothetical protein
MTGLSVAQVAGCGQVLVSLVEVTAALHAMGTNIDDLHKAIDAGEVDRDSCTANNPPTDPGSRAHGTTVRVLRELHIPRGWAACDAQNFSTVVAPDESMEIAVASGDEATGDSSRDPKTKNKKGELVLNGVQRNQRQLRLFNLPPVKRVNQRISPMTWILLRYRHGDLVRCELSLPLGLGDDDRVDELGTRIILPDLVLGGRVGLVPKDGEPGEGETVDVAVVRRSA